MDTVGVFYVGQSASVGRMSDPRTPPYIGKTLATNGVSREPFDPSWLAREPRWRQKIGAEIHFFFTRYNGSKTATTKKT